MDERSDAAVGLVENLALYLKAAFLFPANNKRVVDSAEAVLSTVERLSEDGSWVRLAPLEEEFQVGDVLVPATRLNTAWLRDCLFRVQLAGLELNTELCARSLTEFADLLRVARARAEAASSDAWKTDLPGIRPLELRIRGVHSSKGEEWSYPGGGGLSDGGGKDGAPDEEEQPPALRALLERLMEDPRVRRAAELLRDTICEEYQGGGEWSSANILQDLIGMLPAEARLNSAMAAQMVGEVFDTLQRNIKAGVPGGGFGVSQEGAGTSFRVAKRFFSARFPEAFKSSNDEDLPVGLPRDEGIEDDLDAMLREAGELPPPLSPALVTGEGVFDRELLGICLHRVLSDEEEGGEAVERAMEMLLTESSEPKQALLSEYLGPCFGAGAVEAESHPYWRLVEFLREHRLARSLEWGRFLRPEELAKGFPARFGLFLDTLDPGRPGDRAKLLQLLAVLSRKQVLESAEALVESEGILDPIRTETLLAVSGPDVAPFIEVLAERGDPDTLAGLVRFLKTAELPKAEAMALHAVDPPRHLPRQYLVGLAQFLSTGEESRKLREYSSFLIRKFITDTEDDPALLDRRVYAIQCLKVNPSTETLAYLKSLSRSRRLLNPSKFGRAVRQAAGKTLRDVKQTLGRES